MNTLLPPYDDDEPPTVQPAAPQPSMSRDGHELKDLLANYRLAAGALAEYKARTFPRGTRVRVHNIGRYCGPGDVTIEDGNHPDEVAVTLGNGNTWWYPIETVTPEKTI